jgi:hypothetical protein
VRRGDAAQRYAERNHRRNVVAFTRPCPGRDANASVPTLPPGNVLSPLGSRTLRRIVGRKAQVLDLRERSRRPRRPAAHSRTSIDAKHYSADAANAVPAVIAKLQACRMAFSQLPGLGGRQDPEGGPSGQAAGKEEQSRRTRLLRPASGTLILPTWHSRMRRFSR